MPPEKEASVEYVSVVRIAGEVSRFEKDWGLHGIDISSAKPTTDVFELAVCFVCEIKNGRIHRAREYWDAAGVARPLGVAEPNVIQTLIRGDKASPHGRIPRRR